MYMLKQIELTRTSGIKVQGIDSTDTLTATITIDRHFQEIEKLHTDLVVASVIIVVLVLLLGYVAWQNRKMRRYFK